MTRAPRLRVWEHLGVGFVHVRALLSIALCFAALLNATPACAQDEARSQFRRGAELFEAEDYDAALAAFRASYELREVPVVMFNIAQTLRLLGRYADAIAAYESYLQNEPRLNRRRRAAVLEEIAELEDLIGRVQVQVNVRGAEVRVDSRLIGRAPLREPLRLSVGAHTVEVRHEGYVTVSRGVSVESHGEHDLRFDMVRMRVEATLRVRANVDDALVHIDGDPAGLAPIERQVSVGGHEVRVEAEGYRTWEREVTVGEGQEREVFAELGQGGVVHQWWFWTAIGTVVLAGVITAVAVSGGDGGQPIDGTLGTVAALR